MRTFIRTSSASWNIRRADFSNYTYIPPITSTGLSVRATESTIGLNITITPEQLRQLGGDLRNIRIEVGIGGVTINGQPATPAPVVPNYDYQDRQEVRRTSTVGDRRPAQSFGTIQQHFWSLMQSGRMLQQSDYRLAQRGLLIPEGGLCATTSAVNVLHAAFSHLGRDTSAFTRADDLVARLVSRAWQQHGKDARMGLDFSNLSMVVNSVANNLHPDVGVHAERSWSWVRNGQVDTKELGGDNDTLNLLCIVTSEKSAHAVTLLGVDDYRRVITYSDPNYPNEAISRNYHLDRNQRIVLDGFGNFGAITDVLKIRTKNFDSRAADRWGDYAGKRVRITGQDGRTHLTSIDRIEGPTPEYPHGRVIQYSYIFGSGGGGTWPMEDIASIEAVRAPSAEKISSYEKFVGQKIRVQFSEKSWADQFGEQTFVLDEVTREKDLMHHAFGGLRVKRTDASYAREGIIPFEVIASVEKVAGTKKRNLV